MKRSIILLVAGVVLVAGCNATTQSVQQDQQQTDAQLSQYQKVQPVPFYNWSEQRNTLIQIYNAKNEARNTWAVVESITGTPLWSCPSVGFPIPADTQLTNGSQIATSYRGATIYDGVIDQMEPDGLYSSGNTDATYVLCVRPGGEIAPVYTEQKVTMFPYEVVVENGKVVDKGGAVSIDIDVKGGVSGTPPPSPAP